jgi:PhnB protein
MSDPTPYVHLPGTARAALTFYAEVFGCQTRLNTYADFGRSDGPPDAIAHGDLVDGPVSLFASDIGQNEPPFQSKGLMFALLGTAAPSVLRQWFARLAEGGTIIDDLQERPWGAWDGQVVDRYGLHWLVGFEGDPNS